MMPLSSGSGVKLMELILLAVSQGTVRRMTFSSNPEGMP